MSPAQTTVDREDVARFERLGEDWWDPRGPMRALHKFNPVRIGYLRDGLCRQFPGLDGSARNPHRSQPLAGLRVLDIGCGGGILAEPLARLGATVTGIDPAEGNIEIARRHAAESDIAITYRADTAETLAAEGAEFDAVLAMEVVEHVTDVGSFIATACRLVAGPRGNRPSGLLFAATLNRTLKSFALAIVGAEYVLRWLPRGTHDWRKFLTPHELEREIGQNDLTLIGQTGVIYNPLADRWQLSPDTDVNYMVAAARKRAPPIS